MWYNAPIRYFERRNIMNVLSLFDGISCGQIAFEKLGVTFGNTAERERERVINTLLVK